MRANIFFFFVLCFFFFQKNPYASESGVEISEKFISTSFFHGNLLKGKTSIPFKTEIQNFGLSFGKTFRNSNSKKLCQKCIYTFGATFQYLFPLSKKEILGEGFGVTFFYSPYRFSLYQGKLYFEPRFFYGGIYLTKPYHEIKNVQNEIYSRHINYYLGINGIFNIPVSKKVSILPEFLLQHASNGGMRENNKGVNTISLGVGIQYYLQKENIPERKEEKENKEEATQKKWNFLAYYVNGFDREVQYQWSPNRKSYFGSSKGVAIEAIKKIGKLLALSGKVEYLDDGSVQKKYNGYSTRDKNALKTDGKTILIGPGIHYSIYKKIILWGGFAFSTSKPFNYYLSHPVIAELGLRVYPLKWLVLGGVLKTEGLVVIAFRVNSFIGVRL